VKPSNYLFIVVAAVCLCMTGCLGKPPPIEQYLRVGSEATACAGAEQAGKSVVVAVRPFSALDNLDRQAVLVADGRVLVPSMRWYWEGSPEAIVTSSVTAGINCLPGVGAIFPYRPRLAHDAAISGTISAFNIQEKGGLRFQVGLRLELWSANFDGLLASGEIVAEVPIAGLDASSVADAAAAALADAADQAAKWLESRQGDIPVRNVADEEGS